MADELTVPFVSCHSSAQSTIILIPGAFSSPGDDWASLIPKLPDYHILAPCFTDFKPFTLDRAAIALRNLIITHARDSRAHIYGFSMGATVALALADRYPEVCESVIVSGYGRGNSDDAFRRTCLAYGVVTVVRIEGLVPKAWVTSALGWSSQKESDSTQFRPAPASVSASGCQDWSGLSDDEARDLAAFQAEQVTLARTKELFGTMAMPASQPYSSIPGVERVLVVAATKGNWYLPTNDSVDDVRGLAKAMRAVRGEGRGADKVKAVQAPSLRHRWHVGDPKLCADLIHAWIEGRNLPDEFIEVEVHG